MSIYRIEIEVDGDPYAETDWQNYAVNCLFEAFGTRKIEHIAGRDGVDLTLDNSRMVGHVRMTGPHDDTPPEPMACTADEITSRIYEIATILRDGYKSDALAELANLRDAVLGVQGVGS